jgi:hypothetical protein
VKIKSEILFLNHVENIANSKAKYFHCHVAGDIFRVTTNKKVVYYDFTAFEFPDIIENLIQQSIAILKEKIPYQKALFNHDFIKNIEP